jgi:hypothetical protein
VSVSFIGGGNWSTQRKSLNCCKSLTNWQNVLLPLKMIKFAKFFFYSVLIFFIILYLFFILLSTYLRCLYISIDSEVWGLLLIKFQIPVNYAVILLDAPKDSFIDGSIICKHTCLIFCMVMSNYFITCILTSTSRTMKQTIQNTSQFLITWCRPRLQ